MHKRIQREFYLFNVFFVVVLVVFGGLLWSATNEARQYQAFHDQLQGLLEKTHQLQRLTTEMDLVSAGERGVQLWIAQYQQIGDELEQLVPNPQTPTRQREAQLRFATELQQMLSRQDQFIREFRLLTDDQLRMSDPTQMIWQNRLRLNLLAETTSLLDTTHHIYQQSQYQMVEMQRARFQSMAIGGAVFALVLLYFGFWFRRRIVSPLQRLQEGVTAVKQGSDDFRIADLSADEMGALAQSLNEMLDRLQASHEQLELGMQERLQQVRLMGRVFENLPTGIYAYEWDGHDLIMRLANQSADKIIGQFHCVYLGKPMHEIFPALMNTEIPANFQRVAVEGGVWTHEHFYYADQQVQGAFEFVAFQGAPNEVIVAFRDVTERALFERELKEARDRAEAANLAKSEFLGSLSHELRTPLNAIMSLSQVLGEAELEPSLHNHAVTIERSGQHLLNLINDLLDTAQLDMGKVTLQLAPTNLWALLEEQRNLFGAQAEQKGLQLVLEVAPNVPRVVSIDAGRLRQIFSNLVGNAIKFTARGSVTLTAQVRESPQSEEAVLLAFTVADTGIGIALSDQERIFEAFTQANSRRDRKFGGTGLGLYVSSRLAHLMGGTLTLESSEGQGSRFTLQLSAQRDAMEASAEEPEALVDRVAATAEVSLADVALPEHLRALLPKGSRVLDLSRLETFAKQLHAWSKATAQTDLQTHATELLDATEACDIGRIQTLLERLFPETTAE